MTDATLNLGMLVNKEVRESNRSSHEAKAFVSLFTRNPIIEWLTPKYYGRDQITRLFTKDEIAKIVTDVCLYDSEETALSNMDTILSFRKGGYSWRKIVNPAKVTERYYLEFDHTTMIDMPVYGQ